MQIKVKTRRRLSRSQTWLVRAYWAALLALVSCSHYGLTLAFSRGYFHLFWEWIGVR